MYSSTCVLLCRGAGISNPHPISLVCRFSRAREHTMQLCYVDSRAVMFAFCCDYSCWVECRCCVRFFVRLVSGFDGAANAKNHKSPAPFRGLPPPLLLLLFLFSNPRDPIRDGAEHSPVLHDDGRWGELVSILVVWSKMGNNVFSHTRIQQVRY